MRNPYSTLGKRLRELLEAMAKGKDVQKLVDEIVALGEAIEPLQEDLRRFQEAYQKKEREKFYKLAIRLEQETREL